MKLGDMNRNELLEKYRRIMDSIQSMGNIYYDKGRLEAYKLIALLASDLRRSQ